MFLIFPPSFPNRCTTSPVGHDGVSSGFERVILDGLEHAPGGCREPLPSENIGKRFPNSSPTTPVDSLVDHARALFLSTACAAPFAGGRPPLCSR